VWYSLKALRESSRPLTYVQALRALQLYTIYVRGPPPFARRRIFKHVLQFTIVKSVRRFGIKELIENRNVPPNESKY